MFTEIVRKRYAASSYSAGRWSTPDPSTANIIASVQPFNSGSDKSTVLMRLPEGVRTRGLVKVYTDTELRAADESSGIMADRIVWDGYDWEVQLVDHHALGIFHYKAVCARVNS